MLNRPTVSAAAGLVRVALRRVPSRRAWEASERPRSRGCRVASVVLLAILAGPCVLWPSWGWVIPSVLAVLVVYGTIHHRWHCARMNAARRHDSICTFARSFERRSVDTRVVRGVWNQLDCGYPLRAGDHLCNDLGMDDPDLDIDWKRVLRATERQFGDVEANPWYGRVETVGDLVQFVNALPHAAAMA